MQRSRWDFCLPMAIVSGALAVVLFVGLLAEARERTKPTSKVFATGLTNPRHIRFGPDRLLYVAEAGIGPAVGEEPLLATCEPVDSSFTVNHPYFAGYTGRISRILPHGVRQTVAEGLPSARDGFEDALGPTDIAWIGHTMYVLIEGGGCSRGLPDDPAGIIRIHPDGSYTYVADISAFIRANPAEVEPLCGPQGDCEPDGVPHSLLAIRRLLYVVETNHNSILQVDPQTGAITRLYDLSMQDPAPITMIRMTRKRIVTVVLLLGLVLVAGATHTATLFTPLVPDGNNQLDWYLVNVSNKLHEATLQMPYRNRLTLRFLVDSPLRPPNNPLEWVDGSPDDVLCFAGIMQHPSYVHWILGEAIGCAKIVAQHPLEERDAILALKVRHIIQLIRGSIVDDDFAIVVPLLDSPTSIYTHGLTATTDINNIRPELSTGFYQGKEGIVGVNGNMDLSQFPNSILFNALFTIEFAN